MWLEFLRSILAAFLGSWSPIQSVANAESAEPAAAAASDRHHVATAVDPQPQSLVAADAQSTADASGTEARRLDGITPANESSR